MGLGIVTPGITNRFGLNTVSCEESLNDQSQI